MYRDRIEYELNIRYRMKCIICMSVQLNILCLISINRQYPQNYIEFDKGGHVEFCLDVLEITLLHYYIISNDS